MLFCIISQEKKEGQSVKKTLMRIHEILRKEKADHFGPPFGIFFVRRSVTEHNQDALNSCQSS